MVSCAGRCSCMGTRDSKFESEPVQRGGKPIPFYWKTTCHTCRTSKKSLEEQAVPIAPINILENPPSKDVLRQLIRRYGAKGMVRKNAKEYRTLHVSGMKMSDQELTEFLHKHPDVACRPIVIVEKHAFLSRDPSFLQDFRAGLSSLVTTRGPLGRNHPEKNP